MIELHHQFRVSLPVEDTWDLLLDLPKVAQCLPGASLNDVVEGEYRGGLSTRIGPISAKYRGVASFSERDEIGRRAVIEARGSEEKGSGSASALITASLKPEGAQTLVDVSTELAISGRAAQFGRSLLSEVSDSLVKEFVNRLEAMIEQGASGAGEPLASVGQQPIRASQAPTTDMGSGEQLDVMRTVALPLLRRAAAPAALALATGVVGVLIGRRSRGGRGSRIGRIPVTYVLPYPTERSTPIGG
ncbi:SRPBCC family protein [Solicola gregarius]|uniref:SRPBCC family protein n=1 Tax=Solicola gregarius TaxID=2908642 RepID=A0AA46THN2_9ACTN|nr:SRPBCC family protein [Solicola gregarius]UYM05491.1 SRPBCC family protein [Solicola gregarius]UYM05524.1 SRPBCC family protein [Solicola gregarius]